MQIQPEIAWHNMTAKPDIEKRVNERVAKLDRMFDRITSCRVVIEAPHRRHRKGNEYTVRVDVTLPGREVTVDQKPGDVHAHFDALVAVRDAFDAMERQLRRWKEEHGGRPDTHVAPLQGRVADIDHEAGSGNIAVTDGRLVYFHRNAVVTNDFDDLREGDPVELVVDRGEDAAGAHASTVRSISGQRMVDKPR